MKPLGSGAKPCLAQVHCYLVQVAPLLELVLCVSWIRWGGVGIIPNQSLAPLLDVILYKLLRYLNLSCVSWIRWGGAGVIPSQSFAPPLDVILYKLLRYLTLCVMDKMGWGGDNTKPIACFAA